MGQSGSGEDRYFLPTSDRVHNVDSRDTRLDHLLRIYAGVRVDGRPFVSESSTKSAGTEMVQKRTIDIQIILRKNFRSLVNGIPRPIEYTSKHIFSDGKLHAAASEFDVRRLYVHTRRTLEYLDNGLLSLNFKDLATTFRAVRKC
jgi:hypothetical protein